MSFRTQRHRRPMPVLASALAALAVLAIGLCGTPSATADVCTGGAPYQGSGSPPASLLAAVPFLSGPRWSKEALPQWQGNATYGSWGNQLAYAWYQRSVLWDATGEASWWVVPGQACSPGEGATYDPQDCVMVAVQLELLSFDCLDPRALGGANPPMTVSHGSQLLVSGFAPPGTGSVEVAFQYGTASFPSLGGVYGGSVSVHLGAALHVTNLPASLARPLAAVVLVDETGLFSSSEGPLASTPRLRRVAATVHAHLRSVSAAILGTAVNGHRPHDEVLYGPGARATATGVASALHASRPTALSGGALWMFGSVAGVVVLVGRSD